MYRSLEDAQGVTICSIFRGPDTIAEPPAYKQLRKLAETIRFWIKPPRMGGTTLRMRRPT